MEAIIRDNKYRRSLANNQPEVLVLTGDFIIYIENNPPKSAHNTNILPDITSENVQNNPLSQFPNSKVE